MFRKSLVFLCIVSLVACQGFGGDSAKNESTPEHSFSVKGNDRNKKVVLILIDSMMSELVDRSIKQNKTPALQFLLEKGQYYSEVVAPFPTMSATIESTLITGTMPDKHGIPGIAWYLQDEDRIVNYGSSLGVLMRSGIDDGAKDLLINLNNKHLNAQVTTIFEDLDKAGKTSGAVNTLLYRGNYAHQLTLPPVVNKLVDLPQVIQTKGPNLFAFGQLSRPEVLKKVDLSDGVLEGLGFKDQYSMEVTQQLIKQNKQPDFLMVFLPDYDQIVHKESPSFEKGLEEVEENLQGILNSYDSWQKALDENIFIILGDHGQDKMISDQSKIGIDLNKLYSGYRVAPLGEPVKNGDIAFGVNQRMTYVYDVHKKNLIPTLVEKAKTEPRIDMIAWEEDGWISVSSPDHEQFLRFKEGGSMKDPYGQTWEIEGDPSLIGVSIENNKIDYSDYPDVFNQLLGALKSHADTSKIILTAKPGYSFQSEATPIHPGGGDHGGIHKNDSLSAMIIAGTDQKPEHLRLVDLKKFILQLLTEKPEKKLRALTEDQPKEIELPPVIQSDVALDAKEVAESIEGVTESVSVAIDDELIIAVKVERWHRFFIRTIESDIQKLLKGRFTDFNIHVSTDWKIYNELEKLKKSLKDIKAEEAKKKLKKIEKNMKG